MLNTHKTVPSLALATFLSVVCMPYASGHEVNLTCPATFGQVPDETGLIAYYPFDGNTADVSGNGLGAVEEVSVQPVEGRVGQGYYFNGDDSMIRLPIDISPAVYPQITITAWIKPETIDGTSYIINQGDHGMRNLFIFSGQVKGTAGRGRTLMGSQNHPIYADRWTFVALSYDQTTGTATMLTDGYISTAEAVIPDRPLPSILLGAKAPGNSGFTGTIDEVRVYGRALGVEELAALRNGGSDRIPGDQFVNGDPDRPTAGGPNTIYPVGGSPLWDDAVTPSDGSGQISEDGTTLIPGDQFGSGGPDRIPGDQFTTPDIRDLATGDEEILGDGNDLQALDATVIADVTHVPPAPEISNSGGGGGTRTRQQGLNSGGGYSYAPGDPYLTGVSGRSGSIVEVALLDPTANLGATGIRLAERNNRPCRVDLEGPGGASAIDRCVPDAGANFIRAGFDHEYRITSMRVCTNARNGRVKGIHVRGHNVVNVQGHSVSDTGFGDLLVQDEGETPNCNGNWETLVVCPEGQLATGLRVHFDPPESSFTYSDVLVGLQLYCRALVAN